MKVTVEDVVCVLRSEDVPLKGCPARTVPNEGTGEWGTLEIGFVCAASFARRWSDFLYVLRLSVGLGRFLWLACGHGQKGEHGPARSRCFECRPCCPGTERNPRRRETVPFPARMEF